MISALDKTEVSDALLCAKPLKNRSGAITAPVILVTKIRNQSFLFISDILAFFFNGVAVKPAKRYTAEESTKGLMSTKAGFAMVEIEPNKAAANTAEI
jgi:hypothetical protein